MLSPDGQWIAYLSLPTGVASTTIDEQYLREAPYNIWIMNTETRESHRVAGDDNNTTIERGIPVWSPDSKQLMWVEKQRRQLHAQVIIYDRTTQLTQTLIDQFDPITSGERQYLPTLKWSPNGISYLRDTNDGHSILVVYRTLSGAVPPKTLTLSTQSNTAIIDHIWVKHGDNNQIAVVDLQGNWLVIDPTIMRQEPLTDLPTLVLRNDEDALSLTPYFIDEQGGRNFSWQITVDGIRSDLSHSSDTLSLDGLPAIASDGSSVAWTGYSALGETSLYNFVTRSNTVTTILSGSRVVGAPVPITVVGAPTHWIIRTN
ncbi:MAG: hypothetical protein OHK0046_38850 [Anaerolineae bacterium]